MAAARSLSSQPPGGGRFEAGAVYVLDRARIEVALEARHRYKYVHPRVLPMTVAGEGWRVVSPNCSRSVDPEGGEIDIAWLQPGPTGANGLPVSWNLHARDHAAGTWVLKLRATSLAAVLERLVSDPLKEFWQ